MAELNTIITLRQGTTAEWNASTRVLELGEMGLEYLADGSVKIKAGDGEHLWSALPYIGSDVKAANVFQVEIGENETDDIAAIEAKVAEENAKKQLVYMIEYLIDNQQFGRYFAKGLADRLRTAVTTNKYAMGY